MKVQKHEHSYLERHHRRKNAHNQHIPKRNYLERVVDGSGLEVMGRGYESGVPQEGEEEREVAEEPKQEGELEVEEQQDEKLPVVEADTVVDPGAVVVHGENTAVAG